MSLTYFDTVLRPGDVLTADLMNRLQGAANRALGFGVAPPLVLRNFPGGVILSLEREEMVVIAKADAAIAALSGSTPGSGTCSVYRFAGDDSLKVTGRKFKAFNLSSSQVTSGSWLVLLKDSASGNWLIIYEDCGDSSS